MLKEDIKINCTKLIDAINLNFTTIASPANTHFYLRDRLYNLIQESLTDEDFVRVMIFNNDYLKISPIHTFSAYYLDNNIELSDFEKGSLGRILKYIFNILGYYREKRILRTPCSIKSGKVFSKT